MAFAGRKSDNQKRAYKAEASTSPWAGFEDLAHIQEFLDSVTATEWWTNEHPNIAHIEVTKSLSQTHSMGSARPQKNIGIIGISPNQMFLRYVLHEVAHTVSTDGHGPEWARQYLQLAHRIAGPNAYLELKDAFDREKVNY